VLIQSNPDGAGSGPYVVGLVICAGAFAFLFFMAWRPLTLKLLGRVTTGKYVSRGARGVVEFQVPGRGVFDCWVDHHSYAISRIPGFVRHGQEIDVLYHPGKPKRCVLRDDAPGWPMIGLLLGLSVLFGYLGVFAAVAAWG
jgi:hypothetical protein